MLHETTKALLNGFVRAYSAHLFDLGDEKNSIPAQQLDDKQLLPLVMALSHSTQQACPVGASEPNMGWEDLLPGELLSGTFDTLPPGVSDAFNELLAKVWGQS